PHRHSLGRNRGAGGHCLPRRAGRRVSQPAMNGERGSVTLWMVGLVMVVLVVGGIAIDLWRGLIAYQHLSSLVDSVAVAAGSGIDESVWRLEGRLVLDPERVQSRVSEAITARRAFPWRTTSTPPPTDRRPPSGRGPQSTSRCCGW